MAPQCATTRGVRCASTPRAATLSDATVLPPAYREMNTPHARGHSPPSLTSPATAAPAPRAARRRRVPPAYNAAASLRLELQAGRWHRERGRACNESLTSEGPGAGWPGKGTGLNSVGKRADKRQAAAALLGNTGHDSETWLRQHRAAKAAGMGQAAGRLPRCDATWERSTKVMSSSNASGLASGRECRAGWDDRHA